MYQRIKSFVPWGWECSSVVEYVPIYVRPWVQSPGFQSGWRRKKARQRERERWRGMGREREFGFLQ